MYENIYLKPEISKQNAEHSEKGISNRSGLVSTAEDMLSLIDYFLNLCCMPTCVPLVVKIRKAFLLK